jgi:hypothetical protein
MRPENPWQILPTYKLPKVAAKYRAEALAACDIRARAELLAIAEDYEQRVVEHLVSNWPN